MRNKIILSSVLVLLTLHAWAQTKVGIFISPEINRGENYFQKGESVNDVGLSLGIAAETDLGQRFSLFYGVVYNNLDFVSEGNINQIALSGEGTLVNLRSFEQSQDVLEVPIHLRYFILSTSGKFSPYIFAGLTNSFILKAENKYIADNKTVERDASEDSRYNLSPELGLGLKYKITESIQLNVQPTFRFELNQPITLSKAGLGIGILYKFSRL